MPPQSGNRSGGGLAGATTISIILILVIPSILLIGLCFARKTGLFAKMRGTNPPPSSPASRGKHPPPVAGEESLKSMPVVKYDQKLFAAQVEDQEAGYTRDDAKTADETNTSKGKPLLRRAITAFRQLDWSFLRPKQPRNKKPPSHKQSPSQSSLEMVSVEIQARRVAMQTCAVCTEDFVDGVDVRKLHCGHIFHPHCIDPWLVSFAATCPLCRIDLRAREADESLPEPPRAVCPPAVASV